jgi:hypothetical protein
MNNNNRRQHIQKMTSSSEEDEEDTQNNSNNDWQNIRSTKRKKALKTQPSYTNDVMTTNRFNPISPQPESSNNENDVTPKIIKPPPASSMVHKTIQK